MKRLILFSLLASLYIRVSGQNGENIYEYLNLPTSARMGALGGANVSVMDAELSFAALNPALLGDTLDQVLSMNYINYLGDINYGYISYARDYKNIGTFALGVQHINYGEFDYYDETGYSDGSTFGAKEYAISLMYSRDLLENLTVGGTFKQVYSALERYTSYGILFDAGIHYRLKQYGFSTGFVVRNVGSSIYTYTDDNYEKVPFELLWGFSQKLLHAPFRFSVTARNLQQFDLTYTSSLNVNESEPSFGDKLLRHMVVGVEFMPTKSFYVSGGYNFKRRSELKVEEKPGSVGFSWGFGLRLYKFNIGYSNARYHLASTSHQFTIATNLSRF